MALRCNICSTEIGEDEVESHIASQQHADSKSRISPSGRGSDKSVSSLWLRSLQS